MYNHADAIASIDSPCASCVIGDALWTELVDHRLYRPGQGLCLGHSLGIMHKQRCEDNMKVEMTCHCLQPL